MNKRIFLLSSIALCLSSSTSYSMETFKALLDNVLFSISLNKPSYDPAPGNQVCKSFKNLLKEVRAVESSQNSHVQEVHDHFTNELQKRIYVCSRRKIAREEYKNNPIKEVGELLIKGDYHMVKDHQIIVKMYKSFRLVHEATKSMDSSAPSK